MLLLAGFEFCFEDREFSTYALSVCMCTRSTDLGWSPLFVQSAHNDGMVNAYSNRTVFTIPRRIEFAAFGRA